MLRHVLPQRPTLSFPPLCSPKPALQYILNQYVYVPLVSPWFFFEKRKSSCDPSHVKQIWWPRLPCIYILKIFPSIYRILSAALGNLLLVVTVPVLPLSIKRIRKLLNLSDISISSTFLCAKWYNNEFKVELVRKRQFFRQNHSKSLASLKNIYDTVFSGRIP